MRTIHLPVTTIAEPTRSGLTTKGKYELPLINQTQQKGITKGEWDRIDLPEPTNTAISEGDIIKLTPAKYPNGIGHIHTLESGTAHLSWHFHTGNPPKTELAEELETKIEYGQAEKLASNVSSKEIQFLTGKTSPIQSQEPPKTISIHDLTLTREYKRKPVKQFLNHPSVGHVLGSNYPNSRATFAARYGGKDGNIVAVVDLAYPSASKLDGEKFIELKRYAAHPRRPENTGSWLIAKALEWASLEAYEICRSYTGIAENEGVLYQALNFNRSDGGKTTTSNGDGWTSGEGRENRSTWEDYERGRYDKRLLANIKNIHRRKRTTTITEPKNNNDSQLSNFGVELKDTKEPIDATDKSLTATSNDLVYGRRDNNPEQVVNAINKYSNQAEPQQIVTEKLIDKRSTVVLCGLTTKGIAATLVAGKTESANKHDYSELRVYAYAATETKHPNNTASHLLGKLRKWAGYTGYDSISIQPKQGTDLLEGIKQTTKIKNYHQDTEQARKPAPAAQ